MSAHFDAGPTLRRIGDAEGRKSCEKAPRSRDRVIDDKLTVCVTFSCCVCFSSVISRWNNQPWPANCSIFSTEFTVETADSSVGLKFKQVQRSLQLALRIGVIRLLLVLPGLQQEHERAHKAAGFQALGLGLHLYLLQARPCTLQDAVHGRRHCRSTQQESL